MTRFEHSNIKIKVCELSTGAGCIAVVCGCLGRRGPRRCDRTLSMCPCHCRLSSDSAQRTPLREASNTASLGQCRSATRRRFSDATTGRRDPNTAEAPADCGAIASQAAPQHHRSPLDGQGPSSNRRPRSGAHLQPNLLSPSQDATEHAPLRTPQSYAYSTCDDASPRVIQYAEQVGWLSSRAQELEAALGLQTQRAAALQGELEAAHAQLEAQRQEVDQSAGRLAQEHASALDALEAQLREEQDGRAQAEERCAGLGQRVQELEARCGSLSFSCWTLSESFRQLHVLLRRATL